MVNELSHNAALGDSDHECLNFSLDCYKQVQSTVKMPNYFKANYGIIRERLSEVHCSSELQGDFTTGYVNVSKILEAAMDGYVPEYKNERKKKNMYLTTEVTRKKDLKNKLWRRYKRTKWEYDSTRYITVKNELRSLSRNLRIQFENDIAQNIKSAPKNFWSYVKSKGKTRSRIPTLQKPDGTEAVTAIDKAETLNRFFGSTFTEERLEDIPNCLDKPSLIEYLDSFIITPQMVLKKLQELNPEKSPGPDGWHPILLKNVADLINTPLPILFQKSLNKGLVPCEWLEACITAIHKKGLKI